MQKSFWEPPVCKTDDGGMRCAGFELEIGDVTVAETAKALHGALGGELQERNPFVYTLDTPHMGTIRIERDAELLSSVKYREYLEKLGIEFDIGSVASELEHGIDRLSSSLVPWFPGSL